MSKMQICTHDGMFHADETLAIFMLTQLPCYKDAMIVRSRDANVWLRSNVLVDVGGTYDSKTGRFDHHQKGFMETFSDRHQTKLSSAGLVYKHFGMQLIPHILKEKIGIECAEDDVSILYWYIYKTFIEAIDAHDNGIRQFEGRSAYMSATDLTSRIGQLNVNCYQPFDYVMSGAELQSRFDKAVMMTGLELTEAILYAFHHWLPGRSILEEKIKQLTPNDHILVLNKRVPSWKGHLLELEDQYQIRGLVWFVVFYDVLNQHWKVQTVPISTSNQKPRKPLLQQWAGLDQESLVKLTQWPDIIFVHASGFIGASKTLETALNMAKTSAEYNE